MVLNIILTVLSKVLILFLLISGPTPESMPDDASNHVSLMTYNIHRGRNSNNRNTLNQMIQFMNESDSDIICLQEVMSFQATKIGLATNMHSYYSPNVKNPFYSYGLAIYSKFPIIETNHISLTSFDEPRGFLHAVLKIDDEKKLNVINVHLGLNSDERTIQLNEITNYINTLDGDTVVLGDFNQRNVEMTDWVDVAKHHSVEDNHSYSALDARVDYIFITDNQIFCSHYNVIELNLSDHYPVLGKIK